jgi:hypothetical protein
MALITDPDSLNQATEVTISTAARTFTLNLAGNLSADGVTGQAFYSWLKEEWKSDANLIPYPFPMIGITPEQFEFVDGWKLANDASRKLIRTAGWKEIDITGTTNREYCGITTLGDIDATSKTVGDKAYYSFSSSPSQNFFTYAGPVDEAIQFYGDASNGNFDYTSDTLTLFIRIEGKLYGSCFSTESTIQAKVIKLSGPLAEANDAKITHTDAQIAGNTPYTNMGIEFFASAQTKTGFSTGSHDFGIVVSGATGSVEEIYEFLQWSLRQNSDIDDGAGTHLGTLTDAFAQFVGDRLDTLAVTNSEGGGTGVFLDNVATDDTNSMRMIDNTGTYREYPFVATGNIIFNTNLQNDANAIYRMFFLYTHATAVSDLAVSSSSGANASLDSAGGNLPTLAQNDYIYIDGFTNSENNGLWQITDASPSSTQADATKIDAIDPTNETAASCTVGENPFGTPSAILVDDNSSVDISGNVSANSSIGYDFDYDGNVQGGRTAGEDAEVIVVAIGHGTAQYVAATGTIARSTGNNISLVAALERNYSNP